MRQELDQVIPGDSQASKSSGIYWMCVTFFVVFFLGGIATGWFLLYEPYIRSQAAQHWPRTPCRITQSDVITSRETDPDTEIASNWYSAKIKYAYEVNGLRHESDVIRISGFRSARSGDKKAWEEYVKQYPPGLETFCFVNPTDPTQAVLDNSLNHTDFLIGLFMTAVFTGCAFLFRFVGNRQV